jgi:hypothetical protein
MRVLQTLALPLGYGTVDGSRRSDRLSQFAGYINCPGQESQGALVAGPRRFAAPGAGFAFILGRRGDLP